MGGDLQMVMVRAVQATRELLDHGVPEDELARLMEQRQQLLRVLNGAVGSSPAVRDVVPELQHFASDLGRWGFSVEQFVDLACRLEALPQAFGVAARES